MTTENTVRNTIPNESNINPDSGIKFMPKIGFDSAFEGAFTHIEANENDYKLWSRQPYWTIDEAAALYLGKDPQYVHTEAIQAYKGYGNFPPRFVKTQETITRAVTIGALNEHITPVEFVVWGARHLDKMPEELISAVKNFEQTVKKPQPDKDSPRQNNNLKVALCLIAISHLKYNPAKKSNSTTKEITDIYEHVGGKINAATIKNYLDEGYQIIAENQWDLSSYISN